jgi:acetyltransferase-like isoleucine patch superfamily enzyme
VPIRTQGIQNDGGVTISDDVWLGGNVTALGGVTLEKGCVVGAGAVVTKSMPAYAICKGVPAKVIGSREAESDSGQK